MSPSRRDAPGRYREEASKANSLVRTVGDQPMESREAAGVASRDGSGLFTCHGLARGAPVAHLMRPSFPLPLSEWADAPGPGCRRGHHENDASGGRRYPTTERRTRIQSVERRITTQAQGSGLRSLQRVRVKTGRELLSRCQLSSQHNSAPTSGVRLPRRRAEV
ncbi:hypothetical protein CDD83_3497 [Cordyceps sp. RAO-2017]|nr:hypothetical protein CDD83_3497 [Cordyceps sp. RAO-2017]